MTIDMYTQCHRYGVQVASALLVFILMWILLATLDDGLKDPKHFGPDTKTTFWVGTHVQEDKLFEHYVAT